ncbi:hypothetical protein HLH33_15480 [Gluconacetobacter diazotrophicus]|uniref:Uncharacterized protein n=1 Tax=Gluconacetobacter diazotrophicus TaxID=33996 RepID=A0A7W4NNR0_GLUDI|nr:hypothetical protein [Gluconacetobacter diazotrophicus]MBB2157695.1 hypothetical protein [Gluconacetobacter diazotrophicus]
MNKITDFFASDMVLGLRNYVEKYRELVMWWGPPDDEKTCGTHPVIDAPINWSAPIFDIKERAHPLVVDKLYANLGSVNFHMPFDEMFIAYPILGPGGEQCYSIAYAHSFFEEDGKEDCIQLTVFTGIPPQGDEPLNGRSCQWLLSACQTGLFHPVANEMRTFLKPMDMTSFEKEYDITSRKGFSNFYATAAVYAVRYIQWLYSGRDRVIITNELPGPDTRRYRSKPIARRKPVGPIKLLAPGPVAVAAMAAPCTGNESIRAPHDRSGHWRTYKSGCRVWVRACSIHGGRKEMQVYDAAVKLPDTTQ